MRSTLRWSVLLSVFLGFAAMQAQDITKGSITGVVRDASGAVVQGAEVTLSSPNGDRKAVTDSVGSYSFSNLSAGSGYDLTVTMAGFTREQAKNLTVGVNHQSTQDFTIQVGKSATAIEITESSGATIDMSSTTVGGVLNSSLYYERAYRAERILRDQHGARRGR
jgi:hypothetical protein